MPSNNHTPSTLNIRTDYNERESAMIKAFIFGTVALALSAANASADGYRYGYGHHYGYAVPVFEYEAGAYYGFPAPS